MRLLRSDWNHQLLSFIGRMRENRRSEHRPGLVAVHVLNPVEVQVDVAGSLRYAIPSWTMRSSRTCSRACLWTARMVDDAGWYVDGDSAEVVDEVHEAIRLIWTTPSMWRPVRVRWLLEGRDPAQVVVSSPTLLVVREFCGWTRRLPAKIFEHVRPRVGGIHR